AYAVNFTTGNLQVIDISNPASPSVTGSVSVGSTPRHLVVQGRYAYVANTGSDNIGVYDISNPASPASVGTVTTGDSPYSVSVQGRYAYVASSTANTLQIFDVGGAYIQQLESGGIETGTLSTRGDTRIGGNTSIQGGLTVGDSSQFNGGIGVNGSAYFKSTNNSTTAFQIQNAAGSSALVVDTTPLNTLITNSSAEGTTITEWDSKQNATVTRDITQSYTGSASIKTVLGTPATNDGVKYTPSPALSAQSYALSFYIKQTAGTAFGTNLSVGWNNGTSDSNCTLSPTLTAQPVPTTGWARYSCTFTGSASGHIYWKQADTPASARTFYIDAVQLETGTTASAYKETGIALNGVINSPTTFKNQSDSTTAFQIQDVAGSTLLNADTTNKTITIKGPSSDATVLSPELSNNVFTGWTCTAGWTCGASSATHTGGGGTTTISQGPAISISSGTYYQITWTTSGSTTGSIAWSLGGTTYGSYSGNSTWVINILTANTNNLIATPSSTFDGTISNVSVKAFTATKPALVVQDSTGSPGAFEVRAGYAQANLYVGYNSGQYSGSDAIWNTAFGISSLQANRSGSFNTALGNRSLYSNLSGDSNVATGEYSLFANTTGSDNTANGEASLRLNTTGGNNTAIGEYSLYSNTTGSYNSALGYGAGDGDGGFNTLASLQQATAIGAYSQVQQSKSLILGRTASVASTDQTKIGIGTTAPTNLFSISPIFYNTGTASQSGTTITGVGTTWTSDMVGMEFIFADGTKRTITAFGSTTSLTVGTSGTVSSQAYRIHNPAFYVSDTGSSLHRTSTNSTTAFQIQNASSASLFTVDTSNNVITIGGNNSPELQTWATATPLTPTLGAHTTVTHNGYIYVVGGYSGSATDFQTDIRYAKLKADGTIDATWTTASNPLPVKTARHASTVVNGYLYVIG
ncbi:MAG: hypothetical protein AAB914_03360, partial [Patescibacteria group bacterium]